MAATRSSERGTSGGREGESPVVDLSYSAAGDELDAIIEEFEVGVIDVDRLVERLQRATAIVDELDRRLRRTRMQVEELVPRLEAIGRPEATVAGPDGVVGPADLVGDSEDRDLSEHGGAGGGPVDGGGPAGLF